MDGRRYIDGQVSSPLPEIAARRPGADIVIAVDATYSPQNAEISNAPDVLFQSFMIASQRLKEHELSLADHVIRPKIETADQLGLKDLERLIKPGERAALDKRSDIRQSTNRP